MNTLTGLLRAIALILAASPAMAEEWLLEKHSQPFDDSSPTETITYRPVDHASRPLRFCVLYPHLKDAYWLSVNYGMVEEAHRLGVGFELFEAGGYPNQSRQAEQIESCGEGGFDAMIIGTVSYDGLTPLIRKVAKNIPVIAVVNDIHPDGITAKASVSWRNMAADAGRFLAERHPKGSPPVKVAWFPGPENAGWVSFVEDGFQEAIRDSSAEIVVTRYGDTGREEQVLLIEEVLDEFEDIDYFVGNGPMAEAAVSITRAHGLTDRIGVISTYMTHGVFRGIWRGRILAAPNDFPVLQGRLAIEQAVRAVEGQLDIPHAGPMVVVMTPKTIGRYGVSNSLTPASFIPYFEVSGK
ncbi:monosaccharide ABC transporter substrate-binding protein, CUT2 family [Paracoccus alcaliphilus]|uniref:Monosaccharide ABC transporter substrate-binding protein, CUT2 family n=2 Tax=Paracoccus alcaliphilus TaxID=34002 RepID=A0A1H8MXH8_9RHOB|nr:TMAO reductase system periplasmic protein TorT [Paracoccus alcaliphilus]WCR19621.1 TMAO reductase system periplasmic protein TorT [Paracoccus alcaliphilus]SEO22095.1 monosaccharide ABC transporter substrate-binding protein, CUT2 family [Paracoccus alcaliphilus]